MKGIKNKSLYIIAILAILAIAIVLAFKANSYLSKVILSEPFRISIKGISAKSEKTIKIYGYSPTGKRQVLGKADDLNTWEYSDYSNFTSLYIFAPDSVEVFDKAVIITKNHRIEIADLKTSISNNVIDLTGFIAGKISKIEIIYSIFHWKAVKSFLIFFLVLLIFVMFFSKIKKFFLALILFFNKKTIKKYQWLILRCLFGLGIIAHILFFIITKNYLITSGVFLYILLFVFIFYFFVALDKKTQISLKIKEIKLAIITLTCCFCLIEIALILTGYNSTYFEKRFIYYYSSSHNAHNTNRFLIHGKDHYLKTSEYSYFRKINSEGLSDKEHVILKKRNEFRIVGLGDSFTEGDGTDVDSTWLKFLERSLSKHAFKKEVTYINAGISGSDPYFEYILLKERLLKYRPDLVMVAINNSDISDIVARGGMERFLPDGSVEFKKGPWWEAIYAISHISRLFFDAFGYENFLYFGSEKEITESKTNIVEIISAFKELSMKNNFKLIVIFHPYRTEINSKELELRTEMNVLIHNDIDVFDMLNYYSEKEKINSTNSGDFYWKHDGHHNAKGYAAFARGVEWKLKEMGIMDSLMKK